MTTRRPITTAWVVGLLTAALLVGCRGPTEAVGDDQPPVDLQRVSGTDLYQVTLSEHALDRLGIKTAAVQTAAPGSASAAGSATGVRATIPYAAIVYDNDGSTWAYTVVKRATYLRKAITVDSIVGDTAYLTTGPPTGTQVVVVGAPELLGAEYEISGEE